MAASSNSKSASCCSRGSFAAGQLQGRFLFRELSLQSLQLVLQPLKFSMRRLQGAVSGGHALALYSGGVEQQQVGFMLLARGSFAAGQLQGRFLFRELSLQRLQFVFQPLKFSMRRLQGAVSGSQALAFYSGGIE